MGLVKVKVIPSFLGGPGKTYYTARPILPPKGTNYGRADCTSLQSYKCPVRHVPMGETWEVEGTKKVWKFLCM